METIHFNIKKAIVRTLMIFALLFFVLQQSKANCDSTLLYNLTKDAASKVIKYTKSNGDIYYEAISNLAYVYQPYYSIYKCSNLSPICATNSINTFDSCRNQYLRPFIDSTVIWNQADTLNATCESYWLNNYTEYGSTTSLHLTNGFIYDQNIQLLEDSVLIARNSWARRGFIFYVYDSNTGQNWQTYQIGNTCRGPYNDITCSRYPSNTIEFITRGDFANQTTPRQERQNVINFLDSIPCNAYVLGYSFYDAGYSDWLNDSININDRNLFKAFEDLGVKTIRQQESNKPFAFFLQKCNASFSSIEIKKEIPNIIDTTFVYTNTFTGTNSCKNQSIKKYYSNQYGIVYEVTPINSSNATYYMDCNGNVLLLCGAISDTSFCRHLTDSLTYLNTFWHCQSLCDTVTCLLPGDADHDLFVNNYDVLAIGLSYNRTGNVRPNATSQYTLQACDDWSTTHYYGYNDKFADCNGDGRINSSDALVINQNYIVQAQNHFNHRQNQLDSLPTVTLNFDTLPTMVINGNCDGAELVADINVGNPTQPIIDGYGVAFSVNYPFDNDSCFDVQVDLDPNSWFQTNNPVLLFYKNIPQFNRVDVSIARTDGTPRSGNGRIGKIKMITEGAVFRGGRITSNKQFTFSVNDVVAVNQLGQRIDINGSSTTVNFVVAGVKQNKVDGLRLYPNPTHDKIYINAKEMIESIRVLDLSGRVIEEFLPNKNEIQLDLSGTENGMYIIEIKGKNTVSYEKIFKQ